jgi:hypothetical protein
MNEQAEQVVSWRAIAAHAPVIASDGVEVGHVADVAGLPQEDIFHGVVFTHHVLGHHYLAPAADIEKITDRAVYLKSAGETVAAYQRFDEMHVRSLGVKGIFNWKHLGWKDASE